MAHIGTPFFYLSLLPMYISLNRSQSFWSYKGTFLYITDLSHAHYMTHFIFINPMNSSNSQPHYIIFSVLLLLTPSTGQIFSW
jgi:hypothetical protein